MTRRQVISCRLSCSAHLLPCLISTRPLPVVPKSQSNQRQRKPPSPKQQQRRHAHPPHPSPSVLWSAGDATGSTEEVHGDVGHVTGTATAAAAALKLRMEWWSKAERCTTGASKHRIYLALSRCQNVRARAAALISLPLSVRCSRQVSCNCVRAQPWGTPSKESTGPYRSTVPTMQTQAAGTFA